MRNSSHLNCDGVVMLQPRLLALRGVGRSGTAHIMQRAGDRSETRPITNNIQDVFSPHGRVQRPVGMDEKGKRMALEPSTPLKSEAKSAPTANQRSANSVDGHVGARVRIRRLELGLSQERLADQLGITFQQVQKYERGSNRIGASRLHQISLVLDVPITYFFDGASEESVNTDRTASSLSSALTDPVTMRLLRAFSTIDDQQMRMKAVGIIEAIADTSGRSPAETA